MRSRTVNERLARHYGIPGIIGPTFRRVSYPDDRWRGVRLEMCFPVMNCIVFDLARGYWVRVVWKAGLFTTPSTNEEKW